LTHPGIFSIGACGNRALESAFHVFEIQGSVTPEPPPLESGDRAPRSGNSSFNISVESPSLGLRG
jgi:hypothetical protein